MDDLPAVEAIGADMVDSSELDQYLTMSNQYPSTSSSCVDPAEQYYYHARYHELQPNTAKPHFSVHQTAYQPSYQYVVNNYNNWLQCLYYIYDKYILYIYLYILYLLYSAGTILCVLFFLFACKILKEYFLVVSR